MSKHASAGKSFLRWWMALVILGGLVLGSGRAMAQAVTATVVGTLTDTTGAVVPNVPITLTNQDTGVATTGKANSSGNYEFTFVQPGTYSVSATQTGFKTETKKDIAVTVNTTTRVDLTFQPGASSETVEVTGQPALLQTDRADVSAQIDAEQVEELPVGSERNFQALESLVPGVSRPIYDHSTFFDAQNSQSFQVNGQSELANNLQFEGVDDNERTGLLQVYIPPAAAIKTVDVETSNYAPEFGRSAGAVTNVIMKSGSNQFHGSAYEFNSISALAARSYLNRTGIKPRVVNNYYGATLGGPIVKDKTFFFGDFLRYSNHQGQFNVLTVPTAAFRAGDFSAGGFAIYDPNTGTVDSKGVPSGRTQFSGNIIPTNRISPTAQKILALIPLPNVAGAGLTQNYQGNTQLNVDTTTYDAKIDQKLAAADVLTGRFSWQRTKTVQSPIFGKAGGPVAGGFQGTGINTVYNTALEYTHIFSPKLFAEFRGGVDHYRNTAQNADYGTTASTDLGIPGVNLDAFTSGLVSMDIGAYSSPLVGYSGSLPWVRAETNIDLVNNWTRILGNHSLKAGVEVRRVRDDLVQGQTFGARGVFRYREGQTSAPGAVSGQANDFASFLLDLPSQVGRDLNVRSGSWRQTLYFGFLQDTWVATQKLTLTYGVRYELYPPAVPAYKGGYSQYDPATDTLHVSGYGSVPNNIGMHWNPTDFEPRVGLAYRATPMTVVRAGFGVSRTPFQDNNYAFNYPVRQNVGYNSLSSYVPATYTTGGKAVTLAGGFPAVSGAAIPDTGILQAPANSNWTVVNTNYRDPEVMSYNLTLQQQFAGNWVFDIGYVGNEGRFIPASYNLNAGMVAGAGTNGEPYYQLRKQSGSINLLPRNTTSNYNSLQSRLTHRFSQHFEFTSSLTWQKAMGYISTGGGLGGFNFYIDPHRDYSALGFNRAVTVANSFILSSPFGHGGKYLQNGIAGFLAGGWQISGVSHLETGTPLFFSDSGSTLNTPGTSQVPDQIAPFKVLHNVITGYWFDPTAFVSHKTLVVGDAKASLGNMGKNVYSGPGQISFDAAASRNFRLREGIDLQFRADAFNVMNRPSFGNPNTSRNSSDFGKVTGTANGPRSVQLAATLKF